MVTKPNQKSSTQEAPKISPAGTSTPEVEESKIPIPEATAVEVPEEKFTGTSDGFCPVCSEHGEKHLMRVDLNDWTCPRCSYREPKRK